MRKLVFTLTFLSSIAVYAQSDFQPGYFINDRGQKVTCFIRNTDKNVNPTQFQYCLSEKGEIRTASIDSVSAFEILNTVHKYQRYKVKIERSGSNIRNLVSADNIIYKDEVLFLRVLVESDASLFVYHDDDGVLKFFYRIMDGEVRPLIHYFYQGNDNSIGENNDFRRQLWADLRCPKFSQTEFERLNYSENELVKLFRRYNQCQNAEIKKRDVVKLKKGESQFFFFVGGNASSLAITQKQFLSGPSSNYAMTSITDRINNHLSPVIGFSYTQVLPFNRQKWALCIEPSLTIYKSEHSGVEIPSGAPTIQTIKYTYLTLPLGVKYFIHLTENTKIHLMGAAGWNLVLNRSSVFGSSSTNWTNHGLKQEGFYAAPFTIVGAGLSIKNKYRIEAQYNINKIMLDNTYWKTEFVNSINILLAYRLL